MVHEFLKIKKSRFFGASCCEGPTPLEPWHPCWWGRWPSELVKQGGRNPFVRLNPNDWDLIPWYHMFFSKQLLRLDLTKWSPHFWRDLPNYRRCTNYSNPGQLYPPAPPKKIKVVFFFQGLRRVDKRNQPPQHDMSRTRCLTLTFGGRGCHANPFLRVWICCPTKVSVWVEFS